MNRTRACALAIAPLLAVLAGCGGGGSDQSSSTREQALRAGGGGIVGTGRLANLELSATAEPSCGYDAVNISVDRIRVNKSATAEDRDAGWSEIVLSPPKRIDLVKLANGVLMPLGDTALPAGRYTQMRLVLAPNSAANPLANSVTPAGGTETALATPGAQQSGLKLDVALDLPASQTSDFALDFDSCKSVVGVGNAGQYELKPVIAVIPVSANAGSGVPQNAR